MKTPSKPLKKSQSKDADWQVVNELAFTYYQDQTNKAKRKALYDELTRDRYYKKMVKGKEERMRGPSLLLKQMRKVVIRQLKADLGAGVTDLTQDILHYMLLSKKDPLSKLPIFRETGLLGGYFVIGEATAEAQVMQWTPGQFDPSKNAGFKTFFQKAMTNAFIDYARKFNGDRIRDMGFEGGLVPVPSEKNEELREQTSEELANYGAGRRKDVPMHVSEFLELLTNREFQEFFDDKREEEEDLIEQKEELKQLLKGQPADLREVATQLALMLWTRDDEQDIQERLGLTIKQFEQLKKQAQPLLAPLVEKWGLHPS